MFTNFASMHYVYVLYLNDIPFYAGMTNHPVWRYKHHYHWADCLTYNRIRHEACVNNNMMEMRLVYCSTDKGEVGRMEYKAIRALWDNGFNPLNRNNGGYCKPQQLYPDIDRLPRKVLNKEVLQHVVDNQINILKEYGYKEHKYIDMDNPTGFGRSTWSKYPASSQLGQ